jgi:hypothetical protein
MYFRPDSHRQHPSFMSAAEQKTSGQCVLLCSSFRILFILAAARISHYIYTRGGQTHYSALEERFSFIRVRVSLTRPKEESGCLSCAKCACEPSARKRSYLARRRRARHTPSTKTHSGTQDLLAVESLLLVFMGELRLGKDRPEARASQGWKETWSATCALGARRPAHMSLDLHEMRLPNMTYVQYCAFCSNNT